MSRIHLVVGDVRPQVYIQLRQPSGPVDVSGATVRLKFRPRDGVNVLFQLVGEKLPGTLQAGFVLADLSQYPTAGSGGRVRFVFLAGNLDIAPGYYDGEVEIDYGGDTFTPYTRIQFLLREDF